MQSKPWYVRPTIVCDTCFCHYHEEFELYYDTFLEFGKTNWLNSPPSPTICKFKSKILCERHHDELFYHKKCVNRKHYDRCADIALLHNKYPIDNYELLSNVTTD